MHPERFGFLYLILLNLVHIKMSNLKMGESRGVIRVIFRCHPVGSSSPWSDFDVVQEACANKLRFIGRGNLPSRFSVWYRNSSLIISFHSVSNSANQVYPEKTCLTFLVKNSVALYSSICTLPVSKFCESKKKYNNLKKCLLCFESKKKYFFIG